MTIGAVGTDSWARAAGGKTAAISAKRRPSTARRHPGRPSARPPTAKLLVIRPAAGAARTLPHAARLAGTSIPLRPPSASRHVLARPANSIPSHARGRNFHAASLEAPSRLGYSRHGARKHARAGGDHVWLAAGRPGYPAHGPERRPVVLRVPRCLAGRARRVAGTRQGRGAARGVAAGRVAGNRPVAVVDHEPVGHAGHPRRLYPEPPRL